jgi:hypothetical protein
MKGKKVIAIILSLVTILSMGLSTSIYADENQTNKINITEEEETQLVTFLHENGIDDKTADKLINKFKKGIMWDSLKEEYKNMEPTSIIESPDGTVIKKFVYPDGSVSVNTLVVPKYLEQSSDDQTIGTQYVGGGTWISGTGYRTCIGAHVSFNYGLISGAFDTDFTLVDGGYDYISRVYNPQAHIIGGSISDVSLTITRATESAYQPTEARLQFITTIYGGSGGNISWLTLNVGDNTYYSTNN